MSINQLKNADNIALPKQLLHRKTKSHGYVHDFYQSLSMQSPSLGVPKKSHPLLSSPIFRNVTPTTIDDSESIDTCQTNLSKLEIFETLMCLEEEQQERPQSQQESYQHRQRQVVSPGVRADSTRRNMFIKNNMHRRNPSDGSSTTVLNVSNNSQHRRQSSGLSGCDTAISSVTFPLFNNRNESNHAPNISRIRNQSQNRCHHRIPSDGSMGGFRSTNYFGLACMSLEELASVTSASRSTRSHSTSSNVLPLDSFIQKQNQEQECSHDSHTRGGDIGSIVSDMSYATNTNETNSGSVVTISGRPFQMSGTVLKNHRFQRPIHRRCSSLPLSEESLRQFNQVNTPPTPHGPSAERIDQLRRHHTVSSDCRNRLARELPPVQNISIQNMQDTGVYGDEEYDYDYDSMRENGAHI